MKLQPIDIFIIGLYLVAMIVIGLVLKKKASKTWTPTSWEEKHYLFIC